MQVSSREQAVVDASLVVGLGGEAVAAGLAKARASEEFGDDGDDAEPSPGPSGR